MAAILENLQNVITLSLIVQKISYVGAESHADDDKKLKIETESRISIWRPFVEKQEI